MARPTPARSRAVGAGVVTVGALMIVGNQLVAAALPQQWGGPNAAALFIDLTGLAVVLAGVFVLLTADR